MFTTLVPSYGRDYKSAAAVKADWDANKDFTINDMSNPFDGKQINKQDAQPGESFNVRYAKLTKMTTVRK
jgi:hypothetical protein